MKSIMILGTVAGLTLAGCSDADRAQLGAIGNAAEVTCFSGGREIYRGKSTSKVSTEHQSGGWFFRDAQTGSLMRVSGDCVIKH